MLAAWIGIAIGTVLTFVVGISHLMLTPQVLIRALVVSEVAAFIGLWITIRATQDPWFGQKHLKGTFRTWFLICAIYFGILLGLVPELRSWPRMSELFIPLQLVHGLMAQVYGPLQDYLMKKRHQKTHSQSQNDVS